MRYYPVNLDLKDRQIVVIGGGQVAFRKIEGLLEARAKVTVVDPSPVLEVKRLAEKRKIALVRRVYRPGDLAKAFAVIASTDDRKVNLRIRAEARRKNILLNIIDRPEFCDFVFPSRLQRGEFMVTVSTGGASPALAKKVREDLEGLFGPEYETLVELLAALRKKNAASPLREPDKRFNTLVRSPLLTYLRHGDSGAIDRLLISLFGDGFRLKKLGVKIGGKG